MLGKLWRRMLLLFPRCKSHKRYPLTFIDNPFFYSFFLKTGSVYKKRSLSSFYKDYTVFLSRTLSAIRQAIQPNSQPNSPPQRTSVGK